MCKCFLFPLLVNVALKRPTYHSSISGQDTNSDYAVDGTLCYYRFHTAGDGALPHWLMIDFEERRKVHKIFVLPKKVYLEHFKKVIMTLGTYLYIILFQCFRARLAHAIFHSLSAGNTTDEI